MTVLVVGGNGQLGAACCRELLESGAQVRATVRALDRAPELAELGVDLVDLDVTAGPAARRRAVADVDAAILSANSVVPRAGDSPDEVDAGMLALAEEAVESGIRRLVLPSVPASSVDAQVPAVAARRRLERAVQRAPESWVIRLPPFMESWLGLVGSALPLRGEPHATLGRPSPFLQLFRRATATSIDARGLMLVPGPASNRHAFISVRDVARICAAAVEADPPSGPVDVAGPEVLSWRQVAEIFSEVLGRSVRILSTPAPVYAAMAAVLAPVATTPSRTMALNRYMAATQTPWTSAGGGLVDPASMTTVRDFLQAKQAIGAGD